MARIASGYKISKEKFQDAIEVIGRVVATRLSPSDLKTTKLRYIDEENFEILAINSLINEDWRKGIVEYLKNPTNSIERKIRYRALSYILMGNELFKKTPEGVLLKCLSETEAYIDLSTTQAGTCGAHQVGHKMKWLLI